MTILQFINAVRPVLGMPHAIGFDLHAAEPGDERRCVLALALGCEIGAASDPEIDDGDAQYVMRFASVPIARQVADITGCQWCEPLPCVLLPEVLADIAYGFDDGRTPDAASWSTSLVPVADRLPDNRASTLALAPDPPGAASAAAVGA